MRKCSILTLSLAALLLPLEFVAADPLFHSSSTQYSVFAGDEPNGIAVAPLVGDWRPDLAVANLGESSVRILRNVDGFFVLDQVIDLPFQPRFIAAADFNGDGRVELATTNTLEGNITLLAPDDGDEYQIQGHYPAGAEPWECLAEDFDGDGRPDLAVACGYESFVVTFASHESEGFDVVREHYCGFRPGYLTAGDFDADEDFDLVITRTQYATAVVMLNDGEGNLVATQTIVLEANLRCGDAGDLDHDEDLDLVMLVDNSTGPDLMYTLFNDGDGHFEIGDVLLTAEAPVGALARDFSMDGDVDLSLLCFGGDLIDTYLGDGSGSLSLFDSTPSGGGPRDFVSWDIDLDGDLDLAVTCRETSSVHFFENLSYPATPTEETPATTSPMLGAYPNPFNPSTRVEYRLAQAGQVCLSVFDSEGRRVAVLRDDSAEAGTHSMSWKAVDAAGSPLPSGVYLLRMSSPGGNAAIKLLLLQ